MKFLIFLFLTYSLHCLASSPTKVGNGDDGSDLENLQPITSGILVSTRDKAVKIVEDLNLKNVHGLGFLNNELKHAQIFLSRNEVTSPKNFDGQNEVSEDGQRVYARTLARPYSPVRFFPSALMLTEDQLVRLHIHEALHRSLPESIREDESAVSEITLAITSPDASKDAVENVLEKNLQVASRSAPINSSRLSITSLQPTTPFSRMMKPSKIQYSYGSVRDITLPGTQAIHKIEGEFYLFGEPEAAPGISLAITTVEENYNHSYTASVFDIGLKQTLSTVFGWESYFSGRYSFFPQQSNTTLQDVRFRDVTALQLGIHREVETFFVDANIQYLLPSTKKDIQPDLYSDSNSKDQDYSAVKIGEISAGKQWSHFLSSLKLDIISSAGNTYSYKRDESGYYTLQPDGESFHLVTIRPEIGYMNKNFYAALFASMILEGSHGYSANDVADLSGFGLGSQTVGATFAYHF